MLNLLKKWIEYLFYQGSIQFDVTINDFFKNEKYKNYKFNVINDENNVLDFDNVNNENKLYNPNKEENKNNIEKIKGKINFDLLQKYFSFFGTFINEELFYWNRRWLWFN